MKNNLIYISIFISIILYTASCTKFPDDINVNPNSPTKASNAQLLTYAIAHLTDEMESSYGMLYAQQFSEMPYTENSRYTVINFDFYDIYSEPLANLQAIIDAKSYNVNEGSDANQKAVARILKAYFFWQMTDRWGDIPYSQALKGKDNLTPKYDRQQDIYNDLFKELKEAASQIDNGNSVKGDILYSGNMDNWRMLANSIRMLMALRLSKIDPETGKQQFNDAMQAGIFTSNSQSAVFAHLPEANYENYWYYVANVQERKWYWISEPLVNYMKPLNDPRLPTFADKNKDGEYVGVPYGLDGDAIAQIDDADMSWMGLHVRTQNAPTFVVTYAEILFAMAEAAKTGWISGGDAMAEAYYKQGIEASIRQWNRNYIADYDVNNNPPEKNYDPSDKGDTTGLAAYIAHPSVTYNSSDALKQIAYQKWVHLYMNGYEAWAEWRRTGYPILSPAPDNNNIPIPRRQGYPVTEQGINSANYKAAVAQQPGLNGKDDLNGRMWWDK